MRILISAVGDTDPVRNDYDGPLLHILRHYVMDKVYLLLTADMSRKSETDNRYLETVRWIRKDAEVCLVHTGIEDASDFEAFSFHIHQIMEEVARDYPEGELFMNVTSGTPQIMATLCIASVVWPSHITPIQVKSPKWSSNKNVKHEDSFDLTQLENSLDNLDEAQNRCRTPDMMLYKRAMIKSQLKGMISRYDYLGAQRLIKSHPHIVWVEALHQKLELGALRIQLKTDEAKKKALDLGYDWFFIKNKKASDLVEYFLVSSMRREQGNLLEFVLRISPILQRLAETFLVEALKFPLDRVIIRDSKGIRRIQPELLSGQDPKLRAYLDEEFKGNLRATHLGARLLISIADFCRLSQYKDNNNFYEIAKMLSILRDAEDLIRNNLAHEMNYITDDLVQRKLDMSPKKIEDITRNLITKLHPSDTRKPAFDIYKQLNKELFDIIAIYE